MTAEEILARMGAVYAGCRSYRDAGVGRFNLTPCAPSAADAVAMSGEVKGLLEGPPALGAGRG